MRILLLLLGLNAIAAAILAHVLDDLADLQPLSGSLIVAGAILMGAAGVSHAILASGSRSGGPPAMPKGNARKTQMMPPGSEARLW